MHAHEIEMRFIKSDSIEHNQVNVYAMANRTTFHIFLEWPINHHTVLQVENSK